MYDPSGVALDAAGNLYITDTAHAVVRKVNSNGVITTVAGGGTNGLNDGGAATNASLNWPWGLASDASGDLFFADANDDRVREVNLNGIITTVAGGGSGGFGGAATNARLVFPPVAVVLDASNNLCFTTPSYTPPTEGDLGANLVWKVGTNNMLTLVAGNGSTGYSGDGGAATNAQLDQPYGLAWDALGNLYIADTYNQRIRKVDANGVITTVAGTNGAGYSGDGGVATNAELDEPFGVAVDAFGNLYIADYSNARVRMVNPDGIMSTVAGDGSAGYAGDGGLATNAELNGPSGVAVDGLGNLYIVDGNRIREVNLAGSPTFALTNATAGNAGVYSVVVTSPYTSVTSAVATLTVTVPSTPPQIVVCDGCFGFLTNQFGFDLGGAFGQTIVVDGSTNLVDWTPLSTNPVGFNPVYFWDAAWTNYPSRFYRARLGP